MTVEAALRYASLGFKVFPLHTPGDGDGCSCGLANCKSNGKHPRNNNGLTGATRNRTTIRDWWRQWPDANIGIATDGLAVIDIDPRNGGDLKALEAEHGRFPRTVKVLTGDGHHLYYRTSTPLRADLGAGIDLKSAGGYVIAPPSLHASGKRYRFAKGRGLEDIEIASAPAWLEAAGRNKKTRAAPLPDKLREGTRNQTLASLAGTMRRRGMTEAEVFVALRKVNRDRCEPPLSDAEVKRVAESVANYAPKERNRSDKQNGPVTLNAVRADSIKPEVLDYLWDGYLALGKVHIKAAPPESGKSLTTCDIAARLSRGRAWPDGSRGHKRRSLIISAEDDAADTIVPRLMAAGANLRNITILQSATNAEGLDAQWNVLDHADALADLIRSTRAVYVSLDPLVAYIGKVDTHRDADVRQALGRLKQIAEDQHCVIEGIMHLTKSKDVSALQRLNGSVAFGALARIVLGIVKDPEKEGRYVFAPIKSNIGRRDGRSLSYRITTRFVNIEGPDGAVEVTDQPVIKWLGNAKLDVEEIMSSNVREDGGGRAREAAAFIKSMLASGPMPSAEIKEAARAQGIAERTLKTAKKKLGIKSLRQVSATGKPFWTWQPLRRSSRLQWTLRAG